MASLAKLLSKSLQGAGWRGALTTSAAQDACYSIRQLSGAVASAEAVDAQQQLSDPGLLQTGAFIGGGWVNAQDGRTFEVINPATGQALAQVADCRGPETRAAIAAAAEAFGPWSGRPAKERAAILRRWHGEVAAAKDDITRLMTLECGKPLAESRNEFDSGVDSISWFADEAPRVTGDVLETPARGKRFLVTKRPVGVVGAITPWNFPFSMITRKVSPALAAGCTVVLKPSELTPLTALALAELARRAGVPPGVLSIVPGDAQSFGDAILASDAVRKISFTGSTRVGQLLYSGAAATVKRLSLELGGNAPFIVFNDADLGKAARDVVASSHRNAGQTCICTNRVLVQDGVHDAFAAALVEAAKKLRVGDGLVSGTTHGPLISAAARQRVEEKVADAVGKGARVALGGARPEFAGGDARLGGGYFYEPTVLLGATREMRVFKEETFGPVTPVFKFSTEAEAVALANDTEFGLAAYFYTRDLGRAFRCAEALQYGMVGVNEVAITSEVAPFGGVKHSGLGREHSRHGIDEYLDLKTICLGIA